MSADVKSSILSLECISKSKGPAARPLFLKKLKNPPYVVINYGVVGI
jgi:hypothetical protein